MIEHLGDEAELYPLGLLDAAEREAVERHVARCAACAERVAKASLVAASLADSLPRTEPPVRLKRRLRAAVSARGAAQPRFSWNVQRFALAAAVLLAVLGLGWQTYALRSRVASDDLALVTLINSHFNHVQMTSPSGAPIAAKVLYARDGAWLYVIVQHPTGALHALGSTSAGPIDLGNLQGTSAVASLLARPSARVTSVMLQRDGRDVASAPLVYAAEKH